MTTTSAAAADLEKFQNLLRELFQFDCAELDFGIYRIMNYRRDVVEQFIADKLPAVVASELDRGSLAQQAQANADLEQARKDALIHRGACAIDGDGELAAHLHGTPTGQAYLDAQAAVERDIYNHLYTFFSRYYQDGDFISKRRYSGNKRYAIPYNGEEVYFHWANSDQYYVKTDEHFRNYDWTAPNGVTVHFQLRSANVEQKTSRSPNGSSCPSQWIRAGIRRPDGPLWSFSDVAQPNP